MALGLVFIATALFKDWEAYEMDLEGWEFLFFVVIPALGNNLRFFIILNDRF